MAKRPTAWITLRHQPPYRSDAFADGIESLGWTAKLQFPPVNQVRREDVVMVWNLNPRYRGAYQEAKRAGAPVIVAENGYVEKFRDQTPYYALALDGHNGSGRWFVGKEDRWALLGHKLMEWRNPKEGYILVADQRGIGSDLMKCPMNFYDTVQRRIREVYRTAGLKCPPIVHRTHPGRHQPKRDLKSDLDGAWAVVTWASNVANLALMRGIPAFRMAPYHVNSAVNEDINVLPFAPYTDREAGFQRLAWAQWSLPEITSGLAFRVLLKERF